MAIFIHVDERPDLFITMTCNPNWKFEVILKNSPPGATINDIISFAFIFFYLKVCSLLDDIVKKMCMNYTICCNN